MPPAEPPTDYFSSAVSQLTEALPPVATTTIYSAQGTKLVEKGAVLHPKIYERLTQYRLSAPLQDSLEAQGSINGKSLRATAQTLLEQLPILGQLVSKPALQMQLLQALEALPLPAPVVFQLTVARDVHPALYRYLVCTGLVAGWLVSTTSTSLFDLSMLVAAGLLHDIGMMHIDPVLLKPDVPLSHEQRRQLYSHPLVSELLLQRHHEYPPEMIRAVREHHEMLDGSGYPAGLVAQKISPWGQIFSLAQVVSSLIRPDRPLGAMRLSLLLRTNRHHFDPVLGRRVLEVLQSVKPISTPSSDLPQEAGDSQPPAEFAAAPAIAPVSNPVERLIFIDQVLTDWPRDLASSTDLPQVRRDGMAALGEQCAHMRRIFAETGAAVQQLAMLSDLPPDDALNEELSLITRELGWQLRTLIRRVRRKWALAAGENYPAVLHQWLEQAEEACSDLIDH